MSKIIEAVSLTKVFPPSSKAVDGISFAVDEGEIFGFLGPNGAGKTTTIKMMTTLASITEGNCSIAGHDVARQPNEVRKSIGLVPQDAAVDGDLTGMENLLLSAKLYKMEDGAARRTADALLGLVGLKEVSGRLARTYSGGMRRRLELVVGLIHEPRVLFLDEPTLGLDVQTRTAMWDYIGGINRDKGTTIFLTTHYLEEADSLCDRVAIVDHGKIRASGTPSDLKSSLGGDLLRIRVGDAPDLTSVLSSLPGVSYIERNGAVYSIRVSKVEQSLPGVFGDLAKRQVQVEDVELERASLDRVFLDVTGRSIRDEVVNSGDKFAAAARAQRVRS